MSSSETKTIYSMLAKLVLLLVPALLMALLIVIVDPYRRFDIFEVVDKAVKRDTSGRMDDCLWKVIEFSKKPFPDILLGDSRMENLRVVHINNITGRDWYNFAYGGATLREIIDTFWYAAHRTKLNNVYIGVNFNLYNSHNNRNCFKVVRGMLDNPVLYLFSPDVLKACYYNLHNQYADQKTVLGRPNMDEGAFWELQLGPNTSSFFARYDHPEGYRAELAGVAKYCRHNGIRLAFIIFPTHTDLQRRVGAFGLDEAERTFRKELAQIGTVYDFDYPNAFTADRNNFLDPYHYRDGKPIIDEVWGGGRKYARVSDGPVQ